MRKLAVAGAMMASSVGLFGCGSHEVAYKPCEVVTVDGEAFHRSSYPLGVVAVKFQEDKIFFSSPEVTTGTIIEENNKFTLLVKELPENLANDFTEFLNTDAAVIVQMPENDIGLTKGCIESHLVDGQGNTSTVLSLPTKTDF